MHEVAPENAFACRSKGAKGEGDEKVYDYVIACNSLKDKSRRWRWWKTLSRGRTKSGILFWLKEKRRCRNGTGRSCQRCCLVTVEEGCQEEAQKENAENKEIDQGSREKLRHEVAQEVAAGHQGEGKRAG